MRHQRQILDPHTATETVWRVYECLKLQWQQDHPDGTADEYQEAVKGFAKTLGV